MKAEGEMDISTEGEWIEEYTQNREMLMKESVKRITNELHNMDLNQLQALEYVRYNHRNWITKTYNLHRANRERRPLTSIDENIDFIHQKYSKDDTNLV